MQPVFSPRTTPVRVAPRISLLTALVAIPLALVLAFTYAPTATITLQDGSGIAQPDLAQKIFYLHVPVAFAAYWAFLAGGWNALLHLIKGDDEYDIRSYTGVHVGVVFGSLVLITGSLWAKAAWGVWWQWGDRQLLVFLILYLYYVAYFMLRFSLEPGDYRRRASSVFTLIGIALVPLSFLAVRIAETLIHPTVITSSGFAMPAAMAITFVISTIGFLALATWMMHLEVTGKVIEMRSAQQRAGGAKTGHAPAQVRA